MPEPARDTSKREIPLAEAEAQARLLLQEIKPWCLRAVIAGSIRRRRPTVHDIEILAIPRFAVLQEDLLGGPGVHTDLLDKHLNKLLNAGQLSKRLSVTGNAAWGAKNKLAVHTASGIPVDFFSTDELCWWNSLVVRTGGKASNLMITTKALRMGWSFEAYGSGFKTKDGRNHHICESEADVFAFVQLPYLPPERRK